MWVSEDRRVSSETRSRLAEGAAQAAPTAPHATPRAPGGKQSGPERFWDPRRVRIALGVMMGVSIAFHVWVGPWSAVPEGIDVNDVEGEVGIPVDIVTEPAPDPTPTAQPQATENPSEDNAATGKRGVDGGAPDGALPDAHPDVADAGPDVVADAANDAAVDAPSDGGAEAAATKDPMAMFGATNDLKAAEVYVDIVVNGEEIRKHPVGAHMGGLLSSIPEWDSFIAGTGVDPVKQFNWVRISGPSIVNSSKDVIIVRYTAPDAVVDKAIDVIASRSFQGGPFDAGTPGVKGALGTADNAPRVFLRPRSGVLAVVPPSYAPTAAKVLSTATVAAHVLPGEAMRMRLRDPWRPFPMIPKTVTEVRLWIVPKSDGGADVFAEGDCATEAECSDAADKIQRVFDGYTTGLAGIATRAVTHGLFDSLEVSSEGKKVKAHLEPNQDQLETLMDLVGKQINRIKSPPPPPSAASTASAGSLKPPPRPSAPPSTSPPRPR